MKPSKIDKLGRVVIPIEYRRILDIKENDMLLFGVEDGGVMIRPTKDVCKLCGGRVEKQASLPLCPCCFKRVKALS